MTSSVKVEGNCCKASAFADQGCQGSPSGNRTVDSATQADPALSLGVVAPARNLERYWGCNDCARCVKVEQRCSTSAPTNSPTQAAMPTTTTTTTQACKCSGHSRNGWAGPDCKSIWAGKAHCYTLPGVCADGKPSSSEKGQEWSFLACQATPAPTAPAPAPTATPTHLIVINQAGQQQWNLAYNPATFRFTKVGGDYYFEFADHSKAADFMSGSPKAGAVNMVQGGLGWSNNGGLMLQPNGDISRRDGSVPFHKNEAKWRFA